LNGKEDVALANCILFHSMGAKIDMESNGTNSKPDAKLIGLHSFIPPGKDRNNSQLALKYLKASLGIDLQGEAQPDDALDLLGFFEKCKLAHVFDGPGGKVLLAHAGGLDSDAFFGKAYVDSFEEGVGDITPENYHSTLEQFRRKLSGGETVMSGGKPVMNGGYDRELANAVGNAYSAQNAKKTGQTVDKLLSLEKQYVKEGPYVEEQHIQGNPVEVIEQPVEEQSLVEPSVDAYNKLLKTVLGELKKNPPSFTWRFVLLQALGLKPDKEDARYKSLIQSCSQDGCKGPNTPLTTDPLTPDPADDKKKTTKLAKILKDSGITHVSYGHKPICFPIPVIYQREEVPDVTFISNDTSNGNRKVEEIGENTAIGTMVIFERESGDVKTIKTKIEPVDLNSEKREKGENVPYEKKVGDYSAMYAPLTLATTPFYQQDAGANFLQYGDDKVVFNNMLEGPAQYGQLNFKVGKNTVVQGGKRRSRNRKRITKRGSKHVSKRTKRNKRHAKRSRKQRKY
jgi:hypothetical protein